MSKSMVELKNPIQTNFFKEDFSKTLTADELKVRFGHNMLKNTKNFKEKTNMNKFKGK